MLPDIARFGASRRWVPHDHDAPLLLCRAARRPVPAPASASAVVGGRDATRPYPHMVALRLRRARRDRGVHAHLRREPRRRRPRSSPPRTAWRRPRRRRRDETVPPRVAALPARHARPLDDRAQGETIAAGAVTSTRLPERRRRDARRRAPRRSPRRATKGDADPHRGAGAEKPLLGAGQAGDRHRLGHAVLPRPVASRHRPAAGGRGADALATTDCATYRTRPGGFDAGTMVCAGELHGHARTPARATPAARSWCPTPPARSCRPASSRGASAAAIPTQYGVYSRVGDTRSTTGSRQLAASRPRPDATPPPLAHPRARRLLAMPRGGRRGGRQAADRLPVHVASSTPTQRPGRASSTSAAARAWCARTGPRRGALRDAPTPPATAPRRRRVEEPMPPSALRFLVKQRRAISAAPPRGATPRALRRCVTSR